MIINCINCNKKFDVESSLIPEKGRSIQCSSCNHIWFFKPKNTSSINTEKLNYDFENIPLNNKKIKKEKNLNKNVNKKRNYELTKYKKNISFSFGKILSYIIVLTISFIAFIIIIDTFKTPLFAIFPNFETTMFNLYETLIDIKLFFKDLLQ